MPETPEGKLKRICRAWLREQGAYVFSPVQMGYGAATLDDLVCFKGRFVAIEYKRPDTRPPPTPRQKIMMRQIEAAGGDMVLAYSLDDVRIALESR